MPTLPFVPETLEQLKFRYPQCLEKVWKYNELHYNRPGMHRKYVFDFKCGLRLLISKTDFGLLVNEHVSASWENNPKISLNIATAQVTDHWHKLGGKGKLLFIGMSPNRIPHWVVEQETT